MASGRLLPVGQWLGQSFGVLKTRLLSLCLIFITGFVCLVLGLVLVYVLGAILFGFIQGWSVVMSMVTNPYRLQAFVAQNQTLILVFELLAALVALRIYAWAALAAIHAASHDSLGVRAAFRAGKGRGYGFLGLFIILQIVVAIGFALFFLPGLILSVFLSFALWVFALENAGVIASIRISAGLVRRRFLGVLGRMILVGFLGMLIGVIPVIGWLVGPALVMVAWSLLYIHLSEYEPAPAAAPEDRVEESTEGDVVTEAGAEPLPPLAVAAAPTTAGTRGPILAIIVGVLLLAGSVAVSLSM